jgi:hypothetical protein
MWPSTSPFTNAPTRLPSTFPPFGSIFQCSHRRYTWHEQKRQRTKKKTKKKKKKKKKKKGLKVDKQEELQRGNQSKHADVANEGREQDKHTRENKGKKKKKKKKIQIKTNPTLSSFSSKSSCVRFTLSVCSDWRRRELRSTLFCAFSACSLSMFPARDKHNSHSNKQRKIVKNRHTTNCCRHFLTKCRK